MRAITIDIFSDVVCPWCLIGTRRLEGVLASLEEPVDVTVRYHPYMLDPSTPREGTNVPEMLRRKYGRDPREMFAQVEAAARASGIPLDLSKQPNSYPTAAAHTLLRHAEAKGTQRALSDALFTKHFLEAGNVGDPDELVALAVKHGFDADEARRLVTDDAELATTREQAQEASSRGIRGVPFFIFDGRFALSGAQPPETFRLAIRKALEEQAA